MRYIQKTSTKELGSRLDKGNIPGARYVLLRPAGYPLKSVFQDYPEVSNSRLFERYAREQWYGELVEPGCYLFDKRLYPDFAFQVVKAHPRTSILGSETSIAVVKRKTDWNKIDDDISFDDIVGQEYAKRKMKIIEKYLVEPSKFGKWAPKNVLFYGPSGTGKTMMAKALANETKVPIIPIKATSLIGEFVGEGSRQIHGLYEKAEHMAPCIIFIDELDAIALDRRYQDLRGDVSEIVNALLTEMDGIHSRKGVCTIAATNTIEFLDKSIRSRFEEEIIFDLPSEIERQVIINKNVATLPVEVARLDVGSISDKTKGFSGRDLVEKVIKVALHQAIIEDEVVSQRHIEEAILKAKKLGRGPPPGMFS